MSVLPLRFAPFVRNTVLAVCLCMVGSVVLKAQEGPGDMFYKFTVEGVADRDTAKPLQKALMEHPGVTICTFIPECPCFKLAAGMPMDRAVLAQWIADAGHVLVGDVLVSDGTVLGAPPDPFAPR